MAHSLPSSGDVEGPSLPFAALSQRREGRHRQKGGWGGVTLRFGGEIMGFYVILLDVLHYCTIRYYYSSDCHKESDPFLGALSGPPWAC